MSVTPTPYGGGAFLQNAPSFVCLLSPPDTGLQIVGSLKTGRHVVLGSISPYDALSLPTGSTTPYNSENIMLVNLPISDESQGVFYCEANNRGGSARVPVTILKSNSMYGQLFLIGI